VQELGHRITQDYAGQSLLLIGVLKGCIVFLADLMRHIELPVEVAFVSAASYRHGDKQDGKLEIIVIHNLPGLAQLGGGDRYTKGEVLSLSWGGNGMLENWKTGKIEGMLNSVQIGDLTGDGIEEVLVSAVRTGGITSLWRGRKTVILSYALRPE
jgi:hypothetical protein